MDQIAQFVQLSHKVTSPTNPVIEYYHEVWDWTPGYHVASEHYLEIPTWVAVISGMLGDTWQQYFTISEDGLYPGIEAKPDVVFGSVMDISLPYWLEIVKRYPYHRFILGGYVTDVDWPSNVTWLDHPAQLFGVIADVNPVLPPSYHLFKDTWCVPRLQLSTGCLYKCEFCTVPRTVEQVSTPEIFRQVTALQPLKFELVYLDDKTFGQSPNWKLLQPIYRMIKKFNPKFKGFIIQTTAHEVWKNIELWVKKYHVKVVEIGVETLDAQSLRAWRKPHAPKHIVKATETIEQLKRKGYDIHFVPNIIIGIPGDDRGPHDYDPTWQWLVKYAHVISFVNPYLLCAYSTSKGDPSHGKSQYTQADADETNINKSWLTQAEQDWACQVLDKILEHEWSMETVSA